MVLDCPIESRQFYFLQFAGVYQYLIEDIPNVVSRIDAYQLTACVSVGPRQQTHEWLATIQIDTYVYTDTTL
jgi:hypothetical protein